jgi:hypothetical protein
VHPPVARAAKPAAKVALVVTRAVLAVTRLSLTARSRLAVPTVSVGVATLVT